MGRKRKPYLEVKTTKSIRLPRKLWIFLYELAEKEDSTITLLIQEMVENHIEKTGK